MRELAAPPPIPIRYAGPPSFTTHIPFSGAPFVTWPAAIWPRPAENMMGFTLQAEGGDGMGRGESDRAIWGYMDGEGRGGMMG